MNRLLAVSNMIALDVLLVGCTSVVPVVSHAIPCEISDQLLTKECTQPSQFAEGATFMDLVDNMRADRKALQQCDLSQTALRESIRACNKEIDAFNQKIDELNRNNKP